MTALPLHDVEFDKLNPHRCELCRWWAPWIKERILGTCGKRSDCVDKWDTCVNFEEKDALR